jgi:hypothetical protein
MLYIFTADALVSTGLSKLGYQYVNIGKTAITKLTLVSKSVIILGNYIAELWIWIVWFCFLCIQMIVGQS